ncbi:hypothetical protein [Micromonospora globbae]|uniref:hypothetical protein n=1 Tax=Micromonospora globbae TaxID=1894969 RepID=UPI0037989F2D
MAQSPADADVLAVCGVPGPELSEVAHRLWNQLPGPRARVDIDSPQAARQALDTAEAVLRDSGRQQEDSLTRPDHCGEAEPHQDHAGEGHGGCEQHLTDGTGEQAVHRMDTRHGGDRSTGHGEGHGTSEHRGNHSSEHRHDADKTTHGGGHTMTHAGTGGGDHAGHAGMGHGGMNVAPLGIPLAGGGEDRDGLELDILHVRLGPVLAHWPAGLVLRCALQGDVILDADASVMDADQPACEDDGRESSRYLFAARRCDNAAGLLQLAGFHEAASHARRLRDALLHDDAHTGPQVDRLTRMVRRSWMLRWSLRRLGPVTDQDVARWNLPDTLRGDTRDRLLAMLDRAAQALAGTNSQLVAEQPRVPLEAVADLVRGWDLAAARLIVASLDVDVWTADRAVSRV